MKPEDILVIGDSWSSAVVAGEGDRCGWPQILGIPENNVQAVAGSTAAQWAADWEGRLTRACNTPARCVILSLMGNDMRQALHDGVLTPAELMAGMAALRKVFDAVREGRESMVVLLYADSYGADSREEYAVYALNLVIRATTFLHGTNFLDSERVLLPEHFEVGDIHPNLEGHEAIARAMARMLKIKTRGANS